MGFDIVRGVIKNAYATQQLIEALNRMADKMYRRIIRTSIAPIIITIPVFLYFLCSANKITSYLCSNCLCHN